MVLPGGFSYGDYLRAGAMARFSPVMQGIVDFAGSGGLVLGICNGFQILCESGLLPGALTRNASLRFVCRRVHLRVEDNRSPFTRLTEPGELLEMPVKHGEGRYYADPATLEGLGDNGQVLLRYADADGRGLGRGESQRLGGRHRRHLQPRAQRVRPDAAPRGRHRGRARGRERPQDLLLHDCRDLGNGSGS